MAYSYSTTPLFVDEGDTIQFQYKAPPYWDYTDTVTITIGGLTQYWYITTVPEDFRPDPFPLQPVDNAQLDTMYVYGDGTRPGESIITVSGLTPTTQAAVSISANVTGGVDVFSFRINGGNWTQTSATVQNGDTIQIRTKSASNPNKPVEITLGIGLGFETWVVTTISIPINSPNPFPTFTNLNGLKLNKTIYSNILQVQGLTTTASISLAGLNAEYAISNSNSFTTNADGYDVLTGATFTSSVGTVTNGQFIQLRMTSSNLAFTEKSASLSIGDTSNGSVWIITTGQSESTLPNTFVFQDKTNVTENALVSSDQQPTAGITGLGTGISVPVTLVSATSGSTPKIKINNGSIGVFPATVQNGDKITIYNTSSATYGASVTTTIKVGDLEIPTWTIVTNTGPDSTAVFTPPTNVTNRVPNTYVSSSPVTISGINQPITISATNGALISIDYDTPTASPRTFNPNLNSSFYLVLQSSTQLATTVSTSVTVGEGTANNPFTWSVTTYTTAPPPSSNLGKWYSKKNDKYDGYPIGIVLPVPKKGIDDYGDLSGNLDSRFPGFVECNGASYDVSRYPDLWNVIGNTYGGNGAYNSTTKIYSGTFNVPDYRNRRLVGTGVVDGNKPSSSFLPVTTVGKGINDVGGEGGYWYFDKIGTSGSAPYEQIFGTTGQTTGTSSPFFTLGTVTIDGLSSITTEVPFEISGSVTATVGPISSVTVPIPSHTHFYVSAVIDGDGGDPCIKWGTRALFNTPDSAGQSKVGGTGGTDDLFSNVAQDLPKNWRKWIQDNLPNMSPELTAYGTTLDALVAQLGEGTTNVDYLVWWPSPASVSDSSKMTDTTIASYTREVTGVIDTKYATFKIDSYTPPSGVTNPHSHYLTFDVVANVQTDYSAGNSDGAGTIGGGVGSGLGNGLTQLSVTFNQSDVNNELTDGTFTFSGSVKKPVPDVALSPQKRVPIVTPFHKIKYIIKAY